MGKNTAKKGHGHSKSKERNERARLRKERNRNSYYSDADDREFGAQMEQIGCKIKFIAGDGNCLFRSLADQLEGKPEDHASYRTKVMEHIENNRENFEPYVEDDEPFSDYLVRMKGDAEWGGNQELVAASQLFKTNIVVHQFKAPRFFIPCEKARLTLHLSYHGEHHYNSVRAIGDEGNGPALPITLQTPKAGSRSAGSRSPWPDQEAEVARSCPWASPPNIVHALEATSGRREDAIELLIAARNEPTPDGIVSTDENEAASKPSTPYNGRACDTETNGLLNGGTTTKGIEGSEKGKGLANGNGKKVVKTPKTRKKIPRSAACPCGSGVKYKNCCKKKDGAVARGQLPVPKPGSAMSSPVDSRITDDLGALVI